MSAKQNQKKGKSGKRGGAKARGNLPLATAFPSTQNVLMTYSTSSAFSEAAAGGGAAYFYRLNSVYDPDFSGVGTTAMGYSTFSAVFATYRVKKVTVRFRATATVGNGGFANVVLAPTPISTTPGNPLVWRSMPGAVTKGITPNVNGGHNYIELVHTFDMPRVFRLTRQQFKNDMDFSGSTGSNPARPVYLLVGLMTTGSATTGTLSYSMDMTFQVEWSQPYAITP